jgi:hypothetical protein
MTIAPAIIPGLERPGLKSPNMHSRLLVVRAPVPDKMYRIVVHLNAGQQTAPHQTDHLAGPPLAGHLIVAA